MKLYTLVIKNKKKPLNIVLLGIAASIQVCYYVNYNREYKVACIYVWYMCKRDKKI